MINKEEAIKLAEKIHGHISPGVALGIRMCEIAYKYLKTEKRGRGITGIAETRVCIPDAMQAFAGTTPGNLNLIIKDYGKLALTLAIYDTREGYRVSLKKEASEVSKEVEKFIYRNGKLSKEEREKLVEIFINLDEKYFDIKKVRLTLNLEFKKESIEECSICRELQPKNYMKIVDNKPVCIMCLNGKYFET